MSRNYKEEYKKFHSSPKAKDKRAKLNKINRDKGTYGNGDGKDVSHMSDGSIVLESPSKNRGNKTRTPGDRNARGSYLKKRNVRKAQDGKIVISNESDTISNDIDKNVCLPTDFNCPDSRKRIGKEILDEIELTDEEKQKIIEEVLDLIYPPAKSTMLKKFQKGGTVPSGKRSKSIQDAINWVVDKDATEEKDKLRVLMEATAFLENSFGANEDAYNRDYTNSHWSIDDGFLSDLVTKRSPRYDKVYNDYFNKYEAIRSDRSNLESLLEANDEIASALSARIKYAISPEPLPDTDIDSVVDYWYRNYNSNPNFTKEDIDRKKNEYRKFLESRSSNDTIGREFSTGGMLNY